MDWLSRIFIIGLLWPFSLHAQHDTLTASQADEISYSHYILQDWQQLADFSAQTLRSGIDFYYLRLRAGIAYFQLQQYRTAITHLEKAQSMNPFEQVANDYLYWCYLYSNRSEEALRTSTKMTDKTAIPVIQSVFAEAGIKVSTDTSLANNLHYSFAGLQHRVKKLFTLFHGLTYLQQETHWGNYTQYQYYLKARIPVARSWYMNPGVHFIQLNAAPYSKGLFMLGNMSIEKHMQHWVMSAGYNYSDFFNLSQHQLHTQITWLPAKKGNLWLNCTPAYLFTSQSAGKFFMSSQVGYVFSNRSALQLSSFNGSVNNFSEANGFLVSNTLDVIQHRYSIQYNYPLTNKKEVYVIAQNEKREEFVYQQNLTYLGIIIGFKYKP